MNLKKVFFWTAGVFALIWLGCYLFAGSVPVLEKLAISDDVFWTLPGALSRFWDILFAPIMLVFSVWAIKRYSKLGKGNQPEFDMGLANGFILSLSVLISFFLFHEKAIFALFLGYAAFGFCFASIFTFLGNSYLGFIFSLGSLALGGYGFGIVWGFVAAMLLVGIIFCSCFAGIIFGIILKFSLQRPSRAFIRKELFLREW